MQNVECHRSTVDAKKPRTTPDQPATSRHTTASSHGPIQSNLLRNRSSGYSAKSLIRSVFVSAYLSHRIQPTWLHQKPFWGECTSSSVSENRWWSRWWLAHHSGPF